ncbi:nitroreductase family protein [Enterococcus asini]|uniref:nitroreductase family protein n=3 Tax=Enterococcus TaxID=1350 RepID=UPI00288FCB90|nr:nitroreductase family protein [Enterococcus asini]MDT2756397.1 nitroreductase family protein [Enterococcus asini]
MTHTNDFSEILSGRRSVRQFDEGVKIPQAELLGMIQEAVSAPSSINMQPWRFLVVTSDEAKEKLRPLIRFNTRQNDSSAAMILILGDLQCYECGEQIYNEAVAMGLMPEEVRDKQLATMLPYYQNLSKEEMTRIVTIDASLVAMQLMLVARKHGYDTNPIGGFEAEGLPDALDYNKERYVPVMILAIGKAKEAGFPSYRLPATEITRFE